MSEELLRCPHCGGEAKLAKNVEVDIDGERTAYVMCRDCYARAETQVLTHSDEKAREDAIRAWNRRYELTCRGTGDIAYCTELGCACSECGSWMPVWAEHCPKCGRRVAGVDG